ncbi:T9SS type A sorting domain-containing protein [Avrilella dinanensis]|uniref:Secretion system C-terminal sorting domain-containing protein n=1 Tax=Avrilella dinanensis TaxID=2008672 RepID=A0A2M9R791_9FLAO|nr:T9SS type A sorting domain-containing protein [Avrilella dinanensis]PJR04563.1 hypothetical protein CDL10_08415 [Avrilella dinanensis]
MKKIIDIKKIALFVIIMISFSVKAQTTAIPDPHFEQALIDLGIDSDEEINGQILTSDIEGITELTLDMDNFYINDEGIDFTGIEGFISLEKLSISFVVISHIDLSQNTQLKILNLVHTGLGEEGMIDPINLSANTLLEEFYGGNPGIDIGPFNSIEELDFSNNPNIRIVDLYNMSSIKYINLKNGNNNPDMSIDISLFPWWSQFEDPTDDGGIINSVCIEVDDVNAAQNQESLYADWIILSEDRVEYHFVDNPIDCTASTQAFDESSINIFPNPASDYVSVQQKELDDIQLRAVQILDNSGRWIKSVKDNFTHISVSDLSKGVYLFVIQTDKGNKTEKIIIE